MHPSLTGRLDLRLEDLGPEVVAQRCECAFLCLPHAASAEAAKELLARGVRVIDSQRRLPPERRRHVSPVVRARASRSRAAGQDAVRPAGAVPRRRFRTAQLVANPGCYPTSAILPLAPLLKAGLIEPTDIIVDSKSGVSGAGRTPKLNTHFPECNESISAYGVGKHRHSRRSSRFSAGPPGKQVEVIFTPHLMPMDRGILTILRPADATA